MTATPTPTPPTARAVSEVLEELAARCESTTGLDNRLDVEIEVALFEKDAATIAARANAAGTKVIYTNPDGSQETCWAYDWTRKRLQTAAALRSAATLARETEAGS